MALTKVTVNVLSIPDVSVGLVSDFTPGGLNAFLSSTYATIASPAFTGAPTSVTPISSSNNTQIATTAFVNTIVNSGAYGLASKPSGPRVYFGTGAPSGGNDNDIFLQYI